MSKFKDIYAKWLAVELNRAGHDLQKVIPNPDKQYFCEFVFANTEELNQDIPKITEIGAGKRT